MFDVGDWDWKTSTCFLTTLGQKHTGLINHMLHCTARIFYQGLEEVEISPSRASFSEKLLSTFRGLTHNLKFLEQVLYSFGVLGGSVRLGDRAWYCSRELGQSVELFQRPLKLLRNNWQCEALWQIPPSLQWAWSQIPGQRHTGLTTPYTTQTIASCKAWVNGNSSLQAHNPQKTPFDHSVDLLTVWKSLTKCSVKA